MTPSPWHWWILAGLLLLAEALAPGYVFLWLGVSAAVTGLLALLAPATAWQGQALAFAGLALGSVALWFGVARWRGAQGSGAVTGLNRRALGCVGRAAVLETALVPGRHARLRLGDTTWAATGPAGLPAGTSVRVVGVDGTVLRVEADGS